LARPVRRVDPIPAHPSSESLMPRDTRPIVRVFGLTGGIASGKSTVARVLRGAGATVIDADQLSREVVQPGQPAWLEIKARWPHVIAADGTLDRKALGAVVFANPDERLALNGMVHPRVAEEALRLQSEADARGDALAYYEAALLVENGLAEAFDGLVVVSIPLELQEERLVRRDGFTLAEARQRLAAQLPLSEKVKVATHVLDNTGSVADLEQHTLALHRRLLAEP